MEQLNDDKIFKYAKEMYPFFKKMYTFDEYLYIVKQQIEMYHNTPERDKDKFMKSKMVDLDRTLSAIQEYKKNRGGK